MPRILASILLGAGLARLMAAATWQFDESIAAVANWINRTTP